MPIELPQSLMVYRTAKGTQLCADSREVLHLLPKDCVDLIITSPPFALLRQKTYGNENQAQYVDWLHTFGLEAHRTLKATGSFVIDLGGAYQRGKPVRSLYNFRVLLDFCDNIGYQLAQEFFWYNPATLPSPIEWVNKRKIRVKDAVNTVWWFSKTESPKADVTSVLVPYSKRMRKLLREPDTFYEPRTRPSGHDISDRFSEDKGGAIPPNLIEIANTASNSHYLRTCKMLGRKPHPARFPEKLPRFFINFLTDEGDVVVDVFSGSNTTGYVAEQLNRSWISVEIDRTYAELSAVRFMEEWPSEEISRALDILADGTHPDLNAIRSQKRVFREP